MRAFQPSRVEALESRFMPASATVGLVDSITLKPEVSAGGTAVVMTYTEKNTSHHDITINFGPSTDGFVVKQGSTAVWESNIGIQPLFVTREILKPGQSFTLQATWDGRSNQNPPNFGESGPHLAGKFTVSNELAGSRVAAQVSLTAQ